MRYTAVGAIGLIGNRRSRCALDNALFLDYLMAGLDKTRLITGSTPGTVLDEPPGRGAFRARGL